MKRSLILVAVAVLGVPAAAQGGQVTRMVDDDGRAAIGDCDAARGTYREIESAIDDSGPGDRVLVCPGRYAAFDIHGESKDGLTVQAIERWRAIIYGIAPAEVVRGSFVTVREAEGVTIAGFHIRPGGVTCGYNAIFFLGATGVVRDNRIAPAATDPGCSSNSGIALIAKGAGPTRIVGNVVRSRFAGVTAGPFDGAEGRLAVLDISSNVFYASAYDQQRRSYGILLRGRLRARVDDNVVVGERGVHGIGTKARLTRIRRNTIVGGERGISFLGVRGVIARNDVSHGEQGMFLAPSQAVEVRGNTVHDNGGRGIRIGLAEGLFIHDNDFRGNSGIDCVDPTTGDGTRGTANIWRRNLGDESNPRGICRSVL